MFNQAYDDIFDDDQQNSRNEEREIVDQSIKLMIECDEDTSDINSRHITIHFVNRLWTHFLDDLASPENSFPNEIKASLISIGIFILKHLEKMRKEASLQFKPIREISETIAKGMV